jgi:hypothetical protein
MAKAKPKKERPPKYDEKLAVKGSFLDIMKAAGKDANSKSVKKKP